MNDTEIYNKTLEFAMAAHRGQTRDDGITEYIIHPIRVANMVDDTVYKVVLLLHDVIEDSDDPEIISKVLAFINEIMPAYRNMITTMLDAITKKPSETKEEYYHRLVKNPHATTVKICDRIDNLNDMDGFSEKRALKYIEDSKSLYYIIYRSNYKYTEEGRLMLGKLKYTIDELWKKYHNLEFQTYENITQVTELNDNSFIVITSGKMHDVELWYIVMYKNGEKYYWNNNTKYFNYLSGDYIPSQALINSKEEAIDEVNKYARSLL